MHRLPRLLSTAVILGVITSSFSAPRPAAADPHEGQSVNVAVIDSVSVISGGVFPTTSSGPTGSFTDFQFFTLSVGSVSAAALGPGSVCGASGCDTVLLNVASPGMGCNTNNLTAQQQTDLVNWVATGYKLIIYDSECTPQDYSWLPFSFTTANPGARGARVTGIIPPVSRQFHF